MNKQRRFAVGIGVILAALGYFAFVGYQEGKAYYKTIDEVAAMGDDAGKQRLRVAGAKQPREVGLRRQIAQRPCPEARLRIHGQRQMQRATTAHGMAEDTYLVHYRRNPFATSNVEAMVELRTFTRLSYVEFAVV